MQIKKTKEKKTKSRNYKRKFCKNNNTMKKNQKQNPILFMGIQCKQCVFQF